MGYAELQTFSESHSSLNSHPNLSPVSGSTCVTITHETTVDMWMLLCLVAGPDLKGKMHIANASNVQIGNGNVMVIQSGKRRPTMPRTKHRPEPPITGTMMHKQCY